MSKNAYKGYKYTSASTNKDNTGNTKSELIPDLTEQQPIVNSFKSNLAEEKDTEKFDSDGLEKIMNDKDNTVDKTMDDETKSLLMNLKQQNDFLAQGLEAQQIKNAATEKKIDDVIKMATDLMQNPQSLAPLLSGVMGNSKPAPTSVPEQNEQQQVQNNAVDTHSQTLTQQPVEKKSIEQIKAEQMLDGARLNAINEVASTSAQIPPAFNMDSIGKLVNAVAVISSNFGKKEPVETNPMAMVNNIQSSVELAANIAGTLGSGLGKIFEGFNSMQDRAWKSWQGRSAQQNAGVSKDALKNALKELMLEQQEEK